MITLSLFHCNVDSNVFLAWTKQDLLKHIPPQSVIVMDNTSFHKRKDIQDTIEQAGHIVEYLPPYSPDLNPIEKKWAHIKSIRRKKRCSVDELFNHHVEISGYTKGNNDKINL